MIDKLVKAFSKKYPFDAYRYECEAEDWLRKKLIYIEKKTKEEVISYIGYNQGWEETEDIYRKHFGLKEKYKNNKK